MENRNGLVVDTELLQAHGPAERDAALLMAERIEGSQRVTVAADKGYDAKEFVREVRGMKVTPHVAQNDKRRGGSALYAARAPRPHSANHFLSERSLPAPDANSRSTLVRPSSLLLQS